MRFLTDGVQVELLHHLLEAHVIRATRGFHFEPRRFALRKRLPTVTSHDLDQLLGHSLRGKARTAPGRYLGKLPRGTNGGNSYLTIKHKIAGIPAARNFPPRVAYGDHLLRFP